MTDTVDMVGRRFGPRVVAEYAGNKMWWTICDCGHRSIVAGADLRRGRIKSCRHGLSGVSVRFWMSVVKTDGCWLWARPLTDGYGRIRVGSRLWLAHRWAWENANGPVPAGLELDHLCRVRHCVNPGHMDAVTHAENVRRGTLSDVTRRRYQLARQLGHGKT